MDSTGETIDFMPSPNRDLAAAKLFLRLALSAGNGIVPPVINVDGHPAYARAVSELKESGELGRRCHCRTSPYLNNIKKRIVASLGFRRRKERGEPSKARRQCMRFAKGKSAGWQRVMRGVNVNSSMLYSAWLSNAGLKRIADQVRILPFATDPPGQNLEPRPHIR